MTTKGPADAVGRIRAGAQRARWALQRGQFDVATFEANEVVRLAEELLTHIDRLHVDQVGFSSE